MLSSLFYNKERGFIGAIIFIFLFCTRKVEGFGRLQPLKKSAKPHLHKALSAFFPLTV
jgi:hypothetical protein